MRIRFFLCLFSVLSVAGCSLPRQPIVTMPSQGYSQLEWNSYNRATDAQYTLAIRTNSLERALPLIRGIKEVCSKGVHVTVMLYVGGRHTAPALADTCAEVYLSDYPDLRYPKVVMLVDGDLLSVNGNLLAIRTQDTRQEYFFQQEQKALATRIK